MASFFYFSIILVQLTSSLAIEPVPLKCFLENYSFLNIFDRSPAVGATQEPPASKSFQFDAIKVNFVSFDKHGWIYNATNIDYIPLDDAILDDFSFDLVTNFAKLTFHVDMDVTYSYSTAGSLFSTPIYGNGFAKVVLKNFQTSLSLPFNIKEVDGNKFIELKGVNSWSRIKDEAVFYFDNLYYGNKELSDEMHEVVNKNWKYIVEEFGQGFCDKFAIGVYLKLKEYLLKIPLKNLTAC